MTEDAHRQVRDKLNIAFDDAGEQQLKNITRPVRVYRIMLGEETAPETEREPRLSLPRHHRQSSPVDVKQVGRQR